MVHAQNVRLHWTWIQDGQIQPDLIKTGHAPPGGVDSDLRLMRVRNSSGNETPQWWGNAASGGVNGLPPGLWTHIPESDDSSDRVFLQHNIQGRYFPLGLFTAAMAFFLTSSRAGIVGAALMFFVVAVAFNPTTYRRWMRPRLIAAFLVLLVVSSGIKTQLRFFPGTSSGVKTDWPELAAEALSTFGTRFGSAGVFAGYATMVDRQRHDPELFMHGRVLAYTLTAWVPHLVYPEKPVHPFRDIGYLIRENYSSRLDTVYAPTLVGYAWADFGLRSVVAYLFFGAFALGLLRRMVSGPNVPIIVVVGYLHFTLVEGATNLIHNGFLASLAGAMLALAAIGLTAGYVMLRRTLDAMANGGSAAPVTPAPVDA